jgi:hypothetical protein
MPGFPKANQCRNCIKIQRIMIALPMPPIAPIPISCATREFIPIQRTLPMSFILLSWDWISFLEAPSWQVTFTFPQCRGRQMLRLSLIRGTCRQKEYG